MLLLYPYCEGSVSCRKIERACYSDLAFRYLTGTQHPDQTRPETCSQKPDEYRDSRRKIFDAIMAHANASKHKAMSHARMPRKTRATAREVW